MELKSLQLAPACTHSFFDTVHDIVMLHAPFGLVYLVFYYNL
jgi:hypothetical protein